MSSREIARGDVVVAGQVFVSCVRKQSLSLLHSSYAGFWAALPSMASSVVCVVIV